MNQQLHPSGIALLIYKMWSCLELMVCALEMQLLGVWKAKYPDGHRNEGKCISFPWPQLHTNCSRERFYRDTVKTWASQVTRVVKILPANAEDARDVGSIPGSGKSPGGGNSNPLQYSCRKSHGQSSLAGFRPWGHRESDLIEHTHTHTQRLLGPISCRRQVRLYAISFT